MPSVPIARVVRSGLEESVHAGDVVAVAANGRMMAWAGDPERLLFARSSMKPLQAAVSLSLAPFEFSDREVAVMCGSHNAEPVHVEAVRSLLRRAGVPESSLRCPARRPLDEATMVASPDPLAVNSDCSGKHAGMLAACVAQGLPLESYLDPDHPYQAKVLQAVLRATGLRGVHVGVDGCGAPVHGLSLVAMATLYAGLARPERLGDLEPHAARAIAAMRAEPYMVAGRNRADTAVMAETSDVVVKSGAEGLVCAAVLGAGVGLAVKAGDGGSRAAGPALIRALRLLDALDDDQVERLAAFARPDVLGGGRPVGSVVADFTLSR
ncbi:MAG TPA: asparaginase [Actinomycetota bacterium]